MHLYFFWSQYPGTRRKFWHTFTSYRAARRWRHNWMTVDGRKCSPVARLLNGQYLVRDYIN